MWDCVHVNDKQAVYRYIVDSDADVNALIGQASFSTSLTLAKVMLLQEKIGSLLNHSSSHLSGDSVHKASLSSGSTSDGHHELDVPLDGCSLLHLACHNADVGMIELLLQYGANINAPDLKGQTPLHHCILKGRTLFAKLLLSRLQGEISHHNLGFPLSIELFMQAPLKLGLWPAKIL
ncbi:hypothetical protein ACLOJK_019353 [Asimina triloba]